MGKAVEEFEKLCESLIGDGKDYLYPEISRTRTTDWMAHILTNPDESKREVLARGQGLTMEDACHACIIDYHDRQIKAARKEELLKDPKVIEAMRLFGFSHKGD